ncbi:hypothetical protein PS880_05870 [Pseudomonas fluorescens]|uniref:Uncharacterized protein n=1 Tax=Pseudomonas fluorescens TaxID=294 RepID=A0A5E7Q725_PSEFL|nr:hypothetical protein PS880_05870 [Pseudomonas fluorescens]
MYDDLSNGVIDIVLEKRFDAIQIVNAHAVPRRCFLIANMEKIGDLIVRDP